MLCAGWRTANATRCSWPQRYLAPRGGETLLPALADAQRAKALLGRINEALKGSGKEGLTVGNTSEQIGGGFLLTSKGYEMNCSFEAMLRDVREAEESNVAKILFE